MRSHLSDLWPGGGYEHVVMCVAWNKLYPAKVLQNLRFNGRYAEDEDMSDRVAAKGYSFFVMDQLLYVYCDSPNSLTRDKFNKNKLLFLDVLHNRTVLFASEQQIVADTQKLYCNMYIEYYFKAADAGVAVPRQYGIWWREMLSRLAAEKGCGWKFYCRMYLFRFSPKLYQLLTKTRG